MDFPCWFRLAKSCTGLSDLDCWARLGSIVLHPPWRLDRCKHHWFVPRGFGPGERDRVLLTIQAMSRRSVDIGSTPSDTDPDSESGFNVRSRPRRDQGASHVGHRVDVSSPIHPSSVTSG